MTSPVRLALAALLLLISSGIRCSSPSPSCLESCICPRATVLNCSSSSLSAVPQYFQDFISEVDLTHNLLDSVTFHRPYRELKKIWLGNNTVKRLSLCVDRHLGKPFVRGRHARGLRPWSRCISWGPALQLLSVERNQLEQLPEGECNRVIQPYLNHCYTLWI